jgi:uncharacterized phage protein (TIGR02218 family)
MRTIPSGFKDAKITDLQVCWEVNRRDGAVIRGTEADIDIIVTDDSRGLAGTYIKETGITGSDVRSTDDLAVDNLEVKGALGVAPGDSSSDSSGLLLTELAADDIEAGLYDNAEITTFLVNSLDPDLYQHVLRTGWMGNIRRTAEGSYTTEMRGLTQALSQGIVKTYGVGCQWELGDSHCRVDLTSHTFTNSVAVVTSRRAFQIATPLGTVLNIAGGKVTWTSGFNDGYSMEIKSYLSLQMELYVPMPNDITVGDTLIIQRGCDKTRETCINQYNNILNFGGWGVLVPGDNEVLKVGKR